MAGQEDLTDEQLKALYAWIDAIPLSRPKKNIARDFSDGMLFAEVVAAYFPNLVELHNYTPANSMKQKMYNFDTLNTRVLRKIDYNIPRIAVEEVVNCRPGAVEVVLNSLQYKMAKYRENKTGTESTSRSPNKPVTQKEKTSPKFHGGSNGSVVAVRDRDRDMSSVKGDKDKDNYPSSQLARGRQRESVMASVDEEILIGKEQQIRQLLEAVEILELKVSKLEQLVRLKDNKIQKLLPKN